ncbi:MAG: pyruvate formate lyase-activating protein [Peptococcaceae bacterium]|nr:pyruvate formate lyase-activating protein [Peptococcaceae bacterium]
MQGYLHSIESFSALDGPGIRSVVFLQGCPLRCVYCHNPESWKLENGTLIESSEIFKTVGKNLKYIKKNGGITISGGEPTFQIDFLSDLLKGFKRMGLHTAVDTSGYVGIEQINKIINDTDLFIVDIKHLDPAKCLGITGKTNESALTLLKYLEKQSKDTWIRNVLLPGLTDQEEYIKEICAFVKSLSNVKRFELLPCHNLAEEKYKKLGIPNKNPYRANFDYLTLQKIQKQYDHFYGEKVII